MKKYAFHMQRFVVHSVDCPHARGAREEDSLVWRTFYTKEEPVAMVRDKLPHQKVFFCEQCLDEEGNIKE